MKRYYFILAMIIIALMGCSRQTTPQMTPIPLAPSAVPTPTEEPGTWIFAKLEVGPGLTFYNESGKAIKLREDTLKGLMKFSHYEPDTTWPVEIVIVPDLDVVIEISQEMTVNSIITTRFTISAENEHVLNAGLIGSIGLLHSIPLDPAFLMLYRYSAEDMGIFESSILSQMTYQDYVAWTLDHQRDPISGAEGVSMEAKWAEFQKEFADAGIKKLPMFLP